MDEEQGVKLQIVDAPGRLTQVAAAAAAGVIREALSTHERANLIAATGASQQAMLVALAGESAIDWSRVTVFHLDEYIGQSDTHPASFRRYLRERFLALLNARLDGRRIDLCLAGIGENGHLAFNDPPADFEVDAPFITVDPCAASACC